MPDRLTPNSLLAKLDTQPRVRDFLARAVTSGRASHAYPVSYTHLHGAPHGHLRKLGGIPC